MKIAWGIVLVAFSSSLAFSSPIDCFKRAHIILGVNLSDDSAAFLCSGSEREGRDHEPLVNDPIDCYKKATTTLEFHLSEKNAIVLCQGARSLAPLDCFREASIYIGPISEQNAAILCKER